MKTLTLSLFGTLALSLGTPSFAANSTIDASDESRLLDVVAKLEYHATRGENGVLGAPNRAQDLRFSFAPNGMTAEPRTSERTRFAWGLRTTRFGRTGAFHDLHDVAPTAHDHRVEYPHEGIVEWFVNRAEGLEHGYTLPRRPSGEGSLIVEIEVTGDLSPRLRDEGIDFLRDRELVVRYDKLVAFDATGRELPARLACDGLRLRIDVDDENAAYPLTIDPIATSPSWFAEGNQANAGFGYQVATAGDVNGDGYSDVAIGAPFFDVGGGEGRVFVFHGSATGLGAIPAWVTLSLPVDVGVGWSVSTAGDVDDDGFSDLLVGIPYFGTTQALEGRCLLFRGGPTGLAVIAQWYVESNLVSSFFGWSVSPAGDVDNDGFGDVLIGSPGYSGGQSVEGRADLFRGSAAGLSFTPNWSAESNLVSADFGIAVGYAGDVNGDGFADLAIGATGYSNGQADEGRGYVYFGKPGVPATTPAWTYESNSSGAGSAARFGESISTAGDVNGDGYSDLVVGAPGMDGISPSLQLDEGVVFVFHGSLTGLGAAPAWTFQDDVPQAQIGFSVATAGDLNGDGHGDIVVGSFFGNRAFAFLGSSTGLSAAPYWEIADPQAASFFGHSVATAGDVNGDGFSDLMVGAHSFDGGQTDEGRVLVYHGAPSEPAATPAWSSESQQANARHGAAVATAGDVDGDGYADVIVGAPDFDGGQTNEGRVSLYAGSGTGPNANASWFAESNQPNAEFGTSLASAGDVDGDGYSDVIVGAPLYSDSQVEEGRAYLYRGSATGLGSSPAWFKNGGQDAAEYGISVASAGDVNGDGYADVLVGASSFDGGLSDEGRAFLYLGAASGLSPSAAWTADGGQIGADFGCSVSTAGDIDLDGYCDVIVGARFADYGATNDGIALVYRGGASGLGSTPTWTLWFPQSDAVFGSSVGCAGDVDGNGHSDVIVGAPLYDDPENAEGRAFVYLGLQGGLSPDPVPNWFAESNQSLAQFGISVGSAGDVNGDGFSDIVVGAKFYDGGENNEGRAYTYLGTKFGALEPIAAWTTEGNQVSAQFGFAVGTAGDTNGDGFADLVIGAPEFDNGQTNEGRAFVYFGNGGDGVATRARSLRENGLPLPAGGSAFSDKFAVSSVAHSAIARTDVRLEVEARPAGDEFDGIVTQVSPNWEDSLSIFWILGEQDMTVGPFPDGLYQWRARTLYRPSKHPYQPHGPWFHAPTLGAEQASVRVRALAPVLAIDDLSAIAITHVRGGPLPPSVVREISNAGGSALDWAAEALPTGAWIAMSPPFGSGLLPGDDPKSVAITLNPNGLATGVHTGSVRFSNLGVPAPSLSIPIVLTVVDKMFVPGDTLVAGFEDGYGDEETASFDAVAGMKLKLTFPAVPTPVQALVRIDGPGGIPVTSFIASLGSKKVKKQVTVPSSGLFTLRIEPLTSPISPISIATARSLPGAASSVTKTLKPKKGATAVTVPFQVLPGAVLDLTLTKKKFSGAVSVELKQPNGATFDLSSFTQTLANGDLVLNAVPLSQIGPHELLISGYATDKETLKAKLTLNQPPAGNAIVDMP